MEYRKESDNIGQEKIPAGSLYGIQSLRARNNFPDTSSFNYYWYKAIGLTKSACYLTYEKFKKATSKHYSNSSFYKNMIEDKKISVLLHASTEVSTGKHFDHFIVPGISGGAGTSINMNINEIIANRALQLAGKNPGEYSYIDPIEHANIYQSTNDVIPSSLKLAIMKSLDTLEQSINGLRFSIEDKEKKFKDIMRISYTQMQSAVPSSYGILFSNYSDALSRDWWRVSKCFERIKTVNLGGGATGTGLAVPRYFIMEVLPTLRKMTGFPITRAENITDATSNFDAFVEIHAVMKSLAVNLEKMSSDLRLLASDIGCNEINLPEKQIGSSIMPGKVNPVIPEYTISTSHRVYANDNLITNLSAQGCLDLNAYTPVIGNALLNSLELLTGACNTMKLNLINQIDIDSEKATDNLYGNPAITTALVPFTGYNKAALMAKHMKNSGVNIFEANDKLKIIAKEKLKKLLEPKELLKLGFSLKDIE